MIASEARAALMRYRRCVNAVPIFRNFSLRLFERKAARADLRVQVIFYFVLGTRSPISNGSIKRFRPEIFRIGWTAAELQRNEMVLLKIFQRGIGVAVLANLFHL